MIQFQRVRLAQITAKIGSGATPRGGENVYKSSGISLIRSQNVYDFEFRPDGLALIDDKQADALSNVDVSPRDILLNITGDSIGRCCMAPEAYLPARVNQHVSIIRANARADARYLLYYLNAPAKKADLLSRVHGGTRRALTKGIIEEFEVEIPPLPIQRRIAEILGRLDDKIEVNRRINRTLEAMAQALYRHWFVEFGPFQDGEFVESELGVIPKGWEISSLAELLPDHRECVITGPFGTNLHASDYREEGTPLILVNSVMNGRINEDGLPLVGNHKRAELRRYVLEVGDIVVTRVGVVGNSAYIHPRQTGWMVSGQMLRVRLPSNGRLNPRYLAQTYLTKSFVTSVENNAVGSTRPSLNTEIWKSLPFLVPPIEAQEEFASIVKSADEESENLRLEINALASIRDYLLPKLMSGEVNAAIQM
jgi:type I restriction enzyme S subunit